MPILTDEQKEELSADLEAIVDKRVEEKLEKEIVKRFTNTEITSSPEDKILDDKMGGFKSPSHFISELVEEGRTNQMPETLKAWDDAVRVKDMSEGSLSAGGFLVPPQWGGMIMSKALETSIVMPRASVIRMQSNRITFAADVDTDHSTNYFGGVLIYRPGEAGQKTASAPTYRQIELKLNKITGLCHVSDELLEDSAVAVEGEITSKFTQAIAFVMDYDFINGNGANQPLGIINSANPCRIQVSAETGQGSSTIVAENIIKMWARLYNKDNAVWIANHNTFPQLATMALAVGTGGVPLWMPAGGLTAQPYQTLMGKPLLYTEKCPALGTAGDIILADLSQYKIGIKSSGVQVATSIHFKFDYDQQSFRFVMRYDGQPTWVSALTPKAGDSLSPFLVLNGTRT